MPLYLYSRWNKETSKCKLYLQGNSMEFHVWDLCRMVLQSL